MSTFSWDNFLDVAGEMNAAEVDAFTEARSRASISRAYYAAFHKAKQLLHVLGTQVGHVDAHSAAISGLKNHGKHYYKTLATSLRSLRDARLVADYESSTLTICPKKTVEESKELVRKFESEIQSKTRLAPPRPTP